MAVLSPAIIGLTGAAVDMGYMYSSQAELQRAADAGALAGASTLLADEDGDGRFIGVYDTSSTTAVGLVEANDLSHNRLAWDAETDEFEAGVWDFASKTFSRTGPSSDPADLDTVRVSITREVDSFFIRILGLDSVAMTATSLAHLGCAGDGGKATLPLVVNVMAMDGAPQEMVFNSGTRDEFQWTTFTNESCTSCVIKKYITNPSLIPGMDVGETIYRKDDINPCLLKTLSREYNRHEVGGQWEVIVPVAEWAGYGEGTLVGFAPFVVTQVKYRGWGKGIYGYWADSHDQVAEGSHTGGGCFGIRAASPKLIN